jgi:aryl-alcohol dehydrogenase-like predicted oxidoreductase
MEYHTFPGTDLSVSQLCFGCWGITSDSHWGQRAEDESIQAINAAIEAGVNFFDTAPMYGDGASETLLGKVLAKNGRREQVVIATKIRPDKMRPDDVMQECEDSLRRLQTDHLDLYQTHWTSPDVPIAETWGALRDLQQRGKVRHIGVCNAGVGDLADILTPQKPLTNQLPYNLLSRMIEFEIRPRCLQEKINILVYSPLMHGMLADKYASADEVPDGRARSRHFSTHRPQARHGEPGCEVETFAALDKIRKIARATDRSMAELSLAWTIQQPGIVGVIAGARNAGQVSQNVEFLRDPLSGETIDQLNQATDELKTALGSNPDLWDGGTHSRYR